MKQVNDKNNLNSHLVETNGSTKTEALDNETISETINKSYSSDRSLHGADLLNAIENYEHNTSYLVEGLIDEGSNIMIYGDDGCGKSTINLQMCLQATSGEDVFYGYKTIRPLRIIYYVIERKIYEPLKRIRVYKDYIKMDADNLIISDELESLNLNDQDDFKTALEIINNDAKRLDNNVDIVVLDPIYPLVGSDFVSDTSCEKLNTFRRIIQRALNCTVISIHHSNRGGRGQNAKRIKGDVFGSRFVTANLTGIYNVEKEDGGNGVTLRCEKDTNDSLLKKVKISYDSERKVCYLDSKDLNKKDIINKFFNACYESGNTFSKEDLASTFGVGTDYLKKLMSTHLSSGVIENRNPVGQKGLYAVVRPI